MMILLLSPMSKLFSLLLLCCFLLRLSSAAAAASNASDAEALLALKSAIDPHDSLPWRRDAATGLCAGWKGVKECSPDGRVTKLVLEFLDLTGTLTAELLSPLDQLRVLSFKSNALSGDIPDMSDLVNLKSLYLSGNRFSGRIPATLAALHRLKIVVLCDNLLSGSIPPSLTGLRRLYTLLLQDNRLTGTVPAFDQPSLRYFNVSGNNLSGEIPATKALLQFNSTSFLDNYKLCGVQINSPCPKKITIPIVLSPSHKKNRKKKIAIIAGSVAGALIVLVCLGLVFFLVFNRKRRKVVENRSAGAGLGEQKASEDIRGGAAATAAGEGGNSAGASRRASSSRGGKGTTTPSASGGFSWEAEGIGKLVFCGGAGEMYSMEELLRASAETLGRGTVGSTYKAVMESGFIVTVKRLRDATMPVPEEFRQRTEELGRLRHPNLVPLRAFFQAKEERLLVYDYFPNGSLFSLIHGSRPSGRGKPLHWTSCLKIAEDVATGLLYLHQTSPPTVHGNLKSSNVLLGPDFESCITDYALVPAFLSPSGDHQTSSSSSSSLFYRAPEIRHHPESKLFTPSSDVYSFGVLLLEILTGKTPFQDLVEEHGADISRWVRSVREEEKTDSGDEPGSSGNEASEDKLNALLNIAMACVAAEPERRPQMKEVLKMTRDSRAEAMGSSNSSERSPGRWSDTVQSLPRDDGSESFAQRD